MNRIFAMSQRGKSFAAIASALFCILGVAGCSRGIAQTSAKPQLPPVEYLGSWGVKGDAPGQLKDPSGIATDSFGDVYITDAGNQTIEKFSAKGKPLLSFQEGALKQPQSIAVDSGGGIYVTDPVRSSVFVFFPEGDRYRELRVKTKSSSEDELSVAIGDDGRVHVLDEDAGKVFNYSAPPFRAAPPWLVPVSALDAKARRGPIAAGSDGYIYVADPAGNRILRFASDGHFSSEIDLSSTGAKDRLSSVFTVFSGYIFVLGADGHTLHVVPTDGQHPTVADLLPQLGPGGATASALAVSVNRELFILDGPNAHVLSFRINF
jgi:hypothetical protein